jgi:hypothetical protein
MQLTPVFFRIRGRGSSKQRNFKALATTSYFVTREVGGSANASDIRSIVADYLDRVRVFTSAVLSVDTGLFSKSSHAVLIQHPESLVQMENDFVNQLLRVLNELQRGLTVAEQWRAHLSGLARNLRLTEAEFAALFDKHRRALATVEAKAFNDRFAADTDAAGYLRWVAIDTAEGLEPLLAATQHLDVLGESFVSTLKLFQSSFLERFEKNISGWQTVNTEEVAETLRGYLDQAADSGLTEGLSSLARYLDTAVNLFGKLATPAQELDMASADWMTRMKDLFSQLIEASVKLHEFLAHRSQALLLYVEHELTIIHAILPEGLSATGWFVTFAENLNKTASDLLPPTIMVDTLPYALKQAEDALLEIEPRLKRAVQLLEEADILRATLESPTVNKLLQADQERITLLRTWRPELLGRIRQLRERLG